MALDKLTALLEAFDEFPDPADRTDLLLSYADQFKEVPPEVARGRSPRATMSRSASRMHSRGRWCSRAAR